MENNDLLEVAHKYFGIDSFREKQEEIINTILEKKDCLAILPTGSGKTLCYQLPAIMLNGLTIVVSPLIALMEDQVRNLKNKLEETNSELSEKIAMLHGDLTEEESIKMKYMLAKNQIKILYLSPERLTKPKFISLIENITISLLVVDEAHCISMYGFNFRESYLEVLAFIKRLEKRTVVAAFTATAPKIVKRDIKKLLEIEEAKEFCNDSQRENLEPKIKNISSPRYKKSTLYKYLKLHEKESGIIYCSLIETVEKLAVYLEKKNFLVSRYHGKMHKNRKKKAFEDFAEGRTKIMVATNAFGMGIDKGDIRYVVHWDMPNDIESYSQEVGRAGRDGNYAECILYYCEEDIKEQRKRIYYDNHKTKTFIKELSKIRFDKMDELCNNWKNSGKNKEKKTIWDDIGDYFEEFDVNEKLKKIIDKYIGKILQEFKKPRILYINNTLVAQLIYNGDYEVGVVKKQYLDKSKNKELEFTLNAKLDYFDLCISDAVYSMYFINKRKFFLKNIIEILSGNTKALLEKNIEAEIRGRIKKMMETKITIKWDYWEGKKVITGDFLPLKISGNGYEIVKEPPLYEHAKFQHYQIIQVRTKNLAISRSKTEGGTSKAMPNSIENLQPRHYVLRRILICKNTITAKSYENKKYSKTGISRTIRLVGDGKRIKDKTKLLGIELPKCKSQENRKRKLIIEKIKTILEYQKKLELISDYSVKDIYESVTFTIIK